MQIRWNNLVALALVIVAVVLISRHGHDMTGFLDTMTRIGPGYTPEEQTRGLVAFGLVGVIIVAVVRIVTSNQRGNKDE